ncbi:FxLYD domain-containing protein [Streptomyces sp. NPDC126499]|uniref:FxLYD domain-containing protein n=1 Tax=Streptomyces sp. NPDC126499 TaxID=3155314 RepID=UPI003323DBF0
MSHQDPQPGWGAPPPGQGGPPPPRRRSTGKIIGFSCLGVLALVVVLIIAVVAIGGDDDEPDRTPTSPAATRETRASERPQEEGPEGDVRITACAVDSATKWADAELLITNRSSKTSNYLVQVEFVDASGRRLDEATAATSNLAPGQQSKVTAQGLAQITAKITCRITDVTRYAS